jgi:hypothetical protein
MMSPLPKSQQSPFNFLTLLFLFLFFTTSCRVQRVHGIGNKISDLPLYEDTPTHCDELIELHKWEGTCCSLNVTEGNGCILNVRNGYCRVYGQIWTLNYESTSEIPCGPSEYSNEMLGIQTMTLISSPDPSSKEVSSSGGNRAIASVGMISVSVAFFTVAAALSIIVTML